MDTTITATELSTNLSNILNRVRYRGERFTVACNGEPIAVLEPADVPARHATRAGRPDRRYPAARCRLRRRRRGHEARAWSRGAPGMA
jgi:prevent-host-death family protein